MNREIKFRAWNGVKMKIPFSEMLGYIDDIGLFGKSLSSGIFEGDRNKIILMQYTGLKDKNGVEIYEGDIIEYENGDKYEVYFMNGMFMACNELGYDINNYYNKTKVIGNIHENPELLTNKN